MTAKAVPHPLFDNVLLVGFGDDEVRALVGQFERWDTKEPIPAGTVVAHSTDGDDSDFYEAALYDPSTGVTEWIEVHKVADGECDLCGEPYSYLHDEVGEFWDKDADDSVIAHAQCGIDHGLELA